MSHFDMVTGQVVPDPGDLPSAAPPVVPPPAPVVPTPTPSVPITTGVAPPKGAIQGLDVMQQTITGPSTSGKVVSPAMRAADASVAGADQEQHAAIATEEKNNLLKASIEGQQLEIDHANKVREAEDARKELERRQAHQLQLQAKVDNDVAREQDEYRRNQRGFFNDPENGGTYASRILWGLSLAFSSAAMAYGDNSAVGFRLLDKSMEDWSRKREQSLNFMSKKAQQSGGLLADWIEKYGPQAENTLKLKQAAAYAGVADQIRDMVAKRQTLMSNEAKVSALTKAAEYDQKAALHKQQVMDSRAATYNSGSSSTTMIDASLKSAGKDNAAADKARAETLLDLAGNPVGRAMTPVEGEKIRAAQAATNGITDTLHRLQDFTRKNGTRLIDPDKVQQRDQLVAEATSYLTVALQTGTLNGGEFERYKKVLSGSWLQSGEGAANGLNTIAEGMKNGYMAKLASQGVGKAPAQEAPVPRAGMKQTRKLKDGTTVTGTLRSDGSFEVD